MTKTVIDTSGFPERGDKLRRWRQAVSRDTLPVTIVSHGERPPEGRMTTQALGHLLFVVTEAEPQRFVRSGRRIARGADGKPGYVGAAVVGSTGGSLRQRGRTLHLRDGDLLLWDTESAHEFDFPRGVRMTACLVPRDALGARAEAFAAVTPVTVDPDSAAAAVLGPLVTALAGSAAHCPDHVARQLAGGVTDLVASLVADHTGGSPGSGTSPRQALAQEIRTYVDRNLADAGLSPEAIATAHHMSVRSLHKLFEGEGVTVGGLIRGRRLEECAKDLLRAGTAQQTIAAVARSWGFANPAHFSRLFRSVYGTTPSRWRRTGGQAALPPGGPRHIIRQPRLRETPADRSTVR
ncbi:helix-turn-helix domain-containing protein [Streptomyces sp. NPDC052023]|uniref:helix-turn-helix domain-containing protein n=1 Tax=Streptomyces sp. NPDC052023 TaxID=3365681 RepID=UPI0037D46CDA